ncbi:MAG TPA: fructose-6-phosphate aldolase [Proteobacteria bacterium]|nr:transaldolase [bacterium BMS3Abin14]HDL53008.1 fructose-6-phosphate aldolase [Pseudomonadota bacterium]
MKFFLDTANLDDIISATEMGLIDGVTTNPSLVAREGKEFLPLVSEICRIVHGPVSLETVSPDADGMMKEARDLASIGENVVVKIPMTPEGLKAARLCGREGIRTNVTLVFSPVQALLAAKAGASFISPFVGRIDDVGGSGMDVVAEIMQIKENYGFESEIIVASVRHPVHVLQSALMGADVATVPFKVILQLFKHPLTDLGIEKFLADWDKVPKV